MTQTGKRQFNRKGKKGVAIEMAISTMLIVVAFCLIMLTVAQLAYNNSNNDINDLASEVDASRIAEDFKAALEVESAGDFVNGEMIAIEQERAKLENGLQAFISDGYKELEMKIWLVAPKSWSSDFTTHPSLKFAVNSTVTHTYENPEDPENPGEILTTTYYNAEPAFFILKGYDKDSGRCKVSLKVKAEEENDKVKFTIISYSTRDEDYYFEGVTYKQYSTYPSTEVTATPVEYNEPLLIASDGLSIYGYKNQAGYWDESVAIVKSNEDLVVWAENAYSGGWAYMQGLYGQIVTKEQYEYWLKKTNNQYKDNLDYIGGRGADCYGLIRGYICLDEKTLTINEKLVAGTKQVEGKDVDILWHDLNAQQMSAYAKAQGDLNTGKTTGYEYNWSDTIPGTNDTKSWVAGTAIYREWTEAGSYHQHSAIYIGNNMIIQAADYGIGINLVEASASYNPEDEDQASLWTGWFQIY